MTDGASWRDYGGDYEPPRSMVGPLFLGIVIQVALLIGLRSQTGGFRGDWSYFLGQVTGAALPVPLVLWFAFMRRRDPGGWWKLPAIFLPLSFVLLFDFSKIARDRDAEFRQVTSSIASAGEEVIEKGADLRHLRRSGATGEAGEVERITLGFIEQVAADARAYQRDLEATGLAGIFADPAMQSRAGIPAARAKLAAASAVVERYSRLSASRYDALPRQIEHADLSPRTRAEVIAGFERSHAQSQEYWRRMWGYEREAVATYGTMLDILERARWTRRGQRFTFVATADSVAFNRQSGELDRIVAAEEALDAAQRDRARAAIAGLRGAEPR